MSRLVIESYERAVGDSTGWLAVAIREGQQFSEAGVCGDPDERRAIIGAVHSYFNRQERPAAVVVHEPHPADEWVTTRSAPPQRPQRCMWAVEGECGPQGCNGCEHGGAGKPRFVYTDESAIEQALKAAVTTEAVFQMVYRDQGGNLTERRITVSKVEDRHRGVAGFPETYAVAFDLDKDEPRTFRVDRIERLEAI